VDLEQKSVEFNIPRVGLQEDCGDPSQVVLSNTA
jgi:hypothetical protein